MPSSRPSSASHWRITSVAIAVRLAWVTQFASGFSWILKNSGPSIRLEKFTIGTLTAMPSKSAG